MRGATRGFTLLETLVVIAIVAILAGIGLISYLSYRAQANLDEGTAMLEQAISRGVAEARRTSQPVIVTLNTTARTVQVTRGGTTVLNATLPVDTWTMTCRLSACAAGSTTFTLVTPGSSFPDDLSITLTSRSKTRSLRILGPAALVVRP